MIKPFKKSRFFYLQDCNAVKALQLEELHAEYVKYVQMAIDFMLSQRRLKIYRSEYRTFFPVSDTLSSQILKNAQHHAATIVVTWAASRYTLRLKKKITSLKKNGEISGEQARGLYTCGKYSIDKPSENIPEEVVVEYFDLLQEFGGQPPIVGSGLPMKISEMTGTFEDPKSSSVPDFWMRVSVLKKGRRVSLPLKGNPCVSSASQVAKSFSVRRKKGRWRFETVENTETVLPELPKDFQSIGVDVGLNVLAATSDGGLHGTHVKKVFDRKRNQILNLRANRQRQGLKTNSPKLQHLEDNLTGFVKTEVGKITNKLVSRYPNSLFVLENLDFRGLKGQKRFAYKAIQGSLATKAHVQFVNPAYTSQECPSCGYVSRGNRSGVNFSCRSCGRKSHADWVGASNILRRSEDKDIGCSDHPHSVKHVLRQRYRLRRDSSAGRETEPPPLGHSLTTIVGSLDSVGTVGNWIPKIT